MTLTVVLTVVSLPTLARQTSQPLGLRALPLLALRRLAVLSGRTPSGRTLLDRTHSDPTPSDLTPLARTPSVAVLLLPALTRGLPLALLSGLLGLPRPRPRPQPRPPQPRACCRGVFLDWFC